MKCFLFHFYVESILNRCSGKRSLIVTYTYRRSRTTVLLIFGTFITICKLYYLSFCNFIIAVSITQKESNKTITLAQLKLFWFSQYNSQRKRNCLPFVDCLNIIAGKSCSYDHATSLRWQFFTRHFLVLTCKSNP